MPLALHAMLISTRDLSIGASYSCVSYAHADSAQLHRRQSDGDKLFIFVSRRCTRCRQRCLSYNSIHGFTSHAMDPKTSVANPLPSAFALYDGPLSEYAHENRGGERRACLPLPLPGDKVPEEYAHLAAGMTAVVFKGVIATMWEIGGQDALILVGAYYKGLLALRDSGTLRLGESGAAYALHDAMEVLREKVGEKKFVKWASFVHFGV